MRQSRLRHALAAALAAGPAATASALLPPGPAPIAPEAQAPSRVVAPLEAQPSEAPPDEPLADWCAEGFVPIAGGGCLSTAPTSDPQPLILYLHGRYPRDAPAEEMDRQRRLGERAGRRGYAVLALRGRLAGCGVVQSATWYCWPADPNQAVSSEAFVGTWSRALAEARERVGAPAQYLLGFSNGGYFAGMVASRGWLEVDAVVVAHGGPVEPVRPAKSAPPLLLLSADSDIAQTEMIRFDDELRREHWAHDSYARAGGHGLSDDDIDAALTFFARAGEPLPLRPPLALHRAARHARDGGTDAEAPPAPASLPALPAPEGESTPPAAR